MVTYTHSSTGLSRSSIKTLYKKTAFNIFTRSLSFYQIRLSVTNAEFFFSFLTRHFVPISKIPFVILKTIELFYRCSRNDSLFDLTSFVGFVLSTLLFQMRLQFKRLIKFS